MKRSKTRSGLPIALRRSHTIIRWNEGCAGDRASDLARRRGATPDDIRGTVEHEYAYDLSRSVDQIRSDYRFDETCQKAVPEAITCALESTSFVDSVRNAISLGGDSDTLAAIAGEGGQSLSRRKQRNNTWMAR